MNSPHILQLWNRLRLLVAPAKINLVDDTQGTQVFQGDLGPEGPQGSLGIHDDIPLLQHFGFSSNPPVGSDVVIIHVAGDRSNGVGIAAGHQPSRPTGLSPGDSGIYDIRGAYVRLTAAGLVIEAKNLPVVVNNATSVTINASDSPALILNGDLQVNGKITATGDVKGGAISLENHVHTGVTAGSADTGPAT